MTPEQHERAQEFVDHVAVRMAAQGRLGIPGYNYHPDTGLYCAIGFFLPGGSFSPPAGAKALDVNKAVVFDVMRAHDLGADLKSFGIELEQICENHGLRFPGEWF